MVKRKVTVRAADTLLHTLREQLGLTGAKAGCENGDCGACTVLVDGWPIKSCLMLAVSSGSLLLLSLKNALHRRLFENWGFQCGYVHRIYHELSCLGTIHPGADDDTIADGYNQYLQMHQLKR